MIYQIKESDVHALVHQFYKKVRMHPDLGPVFKDSIGDSESDWTPHLKKMVSFWMTLTTGRVSYKGNPLQRHKELPSFDKRLFTIWLSLFEETAREVFDDSTAFIFIDKSRRVAKVFVKEIYEKTDKDSQ